VDFFRWRDISLIITRRLQLWPGGLADRHVDCWPKGFASTTALTMSAAGLTRRIRPTPVPACGTILRCRPQAEFPCASSGLHQRDVLVIEHPEFLIFVAFVLDRTAVVTRGPPLGLLQTIVESGPVSEPFPISGANDLVLPSF
jgi:hypothetical protein